MREIKFITTVAEWFIASKAPDLKDKIDDCLKIIESGSTLEGNNKKLFGFMLFSYSMNHGPETFLIVEKEAESLCVTDEFKAYAEDWINHSKKTKTIN